MPRPNPPSRWRLVVAATAFAALAAACTTVPQAPPAGTGDVFSGRLALRVEPAGGQSPRAVSAAFDLRGDSRAGTLGLSTPLGSMIAQARWSPAEVVLTTPRETRRFASLDELTREALGESVPIEAWFDWLRGRPWTGAPSAPVGVAAGAPVDVASAASSERTPNGPSAAPGPGFRQLGWRVDLAQFGAGTIAATRETPAPVVSVRIRLDGS
jgi:outer membrane lipoprotein LolB